MKLWELVKQAQQTQKMLLSLAGKQLPPNLLSPSQLDQEEDEQQNQFLNVDYKDNHQKQNESQPKQSDKIRSVQYTFQNSKKDIVQAQNLQKSKIQQLQYQSQSISQEQSKLFNDSIMEKQRQIAINISDISKCDFLAMIEGIQFQEGKKLSQNGISKILDSLKQFVQGYKNAQNSNVSSKITILQQQRKHQLSTGRNSQVKKVGLISNKQNSLENHKYKVGTINYRSRHSLKRNQNTSNPMGKILKQRKQNRK